MAKKKGDFFPAPKKGPSERTVRQEVAAHRKSLREALAAYKKGEASLSHAARMANVENEEMHRILVREGLLRTGATTKNVDAESDFLAGESKKEPRAPNA